MTIDLDAARRRVERDLDRVMRLLEERRRELGADAAADPLANVDQRAADQGSETVEREMDLTLLNELETEAGELRAALERIDNGTYGIDEVTGEPIAPERLEAFPAARTNADTSGR